MQIKIIGDPKEIAALVAAIQERQNVDIEEIASDWGGNIITVTKERETK